MKNKVFLGILILFIVVIIGLFILGNNLYNKYNDISLTIDDKINNLDDNINKNYSILIEKVKDNDMKQKNVDNMKDYINLLEEKVKTYE